MTQNDFCNTIGTKRTWRRRSAMSAFGSKADIGWRRLNRPSDADAHSQARLRGSSTNCVRDPRNKCLNVSRRAGRSVRRIPEPMRIQPEPHADKTSWQLRAIYHLQTTLLENPRAFDAVR